MSTVHGYVFFYNEVVGWRYDELTTYNWPSIHWNELSIVTIPSWMWRISFLLATRTFSHWSFIFLSASTIWSTSSMHFLLYLSGGQQSLLVSAPPRSGDGLIWRSSDLLPETFYNLSSSYIRQHCYSQQYTAGRDYSDEGISIEKGRINGDKGEILLDAAVRLWCC